MAVTLGEAFDAALELAAAIEGVESLPLHRAAGRVLATGLAVAAPYPAFTHAAVDGYAVRAAECGAPPTRLRCDQHILPGGRAAPLAPGMAARIFTGAALPAGADAVAMQEECTPVDGGAAVEIGTGLAPGQNVRQAGEDMQPGQELLAAGTLLDARHLAAAAAAGIAHLPVRRQVRVAFLSCGNELVPAGAAGQGGAAARDSNRPMLAAWLSRPWIAPHDLGILPDAPEALTSALAAAAAEADLVISSGGMSVGDSDHLAAAVEAAGGAWTALQVRMKPGKPVGLGRLGGAAMLALPGNPYAAFVGAVMFGTLVLRRLSGQAAARPAGRPAGFDGPAPPRGSRTEFVPVAILDPPPASAAGGGANLLLRALGPGGSARLAPLLAADGLAELAPDPPEAAGDPPVRFHAFADLL